jgi:hypothetical protein
VAKLTSDQRKGMDPGQFALPGKRFPIEDKVHAQKALQLAPRSEKAGNITPEQEASVQRQARTKLKAGKATQRGPKRNKATVL